MSPDKPSPSSFIMGVLVVLALLGVALTVLLVAAVMVVSAGDSY